MAKPKNVKLYDIIPSQDTMCYMLKYSIHKMVTNIPMSMAVTEKIDFKKMQQALNLEIERNDCMRLRFVKEHGRVMQYFIPPYKASETQILKFYTLEEQEEFFNSDASKPVKFFKDETYRVYFFTDYLGKCGVYINAAHVIMDAMSVSVFFRDLFAVYNSLVSGSEMPPQLSSFEAYLQKEYDYLANKKRYEEDLQYVKDTLHAMGEPLYCGIHGPELLDKKREKKPDLRVPAVFDPIHDRSELLRFSASEEDSQLILDYCQQTGISPELLIATGYKIHASAINHRANDTTMMVLCSRRVTKKEQNMGGCLAQPLRMRTQTTENMTFNQVIEGASKQRAVMFMHSNLPYKDALRVERDEYKYSEAQSPSFMMFTWLPLEKMSECFGAEADFRGYDMGRYILPLYTFSYRSLDKKRIEFYYMHRMNLISKEQIILLHQNSIKAIITGIKNPQITLNELYTMLLAK